jgi:hypothetical protein
LAEQFPTMPAYRQRVANTNKAWGMIDLEPIACVQFADAAVRPVFAGSGRQCVMDDDGNSVCGVRFIPRDAADEPIIVGPDDEFPF